MNILQLKEFCEGTPLVSHSAQFEYRWLLSRGIDPQIVDDTKLLAYLYDNRISLDLESLCLRFNIDKVFKEEWGSDVANMPPARRRERNIRDARNTIILRDELWSRLNDGEKKVYKEVLLPATRTVAIVEQKGLRISKEKLDKLLGMIKTKQEELDLLNDPVIKQFEEDIGKPFNPRSSPHKKVLLFDYLGYTPMEFRQSKTKTGDYGTAAKILDAYLKVKHSDTLAKVRQAAAYAGWLSTYGSLFEKCTKGKDACNQYHYHERDGKYFINCNLYLGETNTGRAKSSHPNLQNLPGKDKVWTRFPFIPTYDNGFLLEADYDGIELRLIAGVSGDEQLLEGFVAGIDPHVAMASVALNRGVKTISESDRDFGKTLNYAIPFGRGAEGIAFDTGVTKSEAQVWLKRYWAQHARLQDYLKGIPKKGWVYSRTGMKRYCETWQQGKNFGIQNPAMIALLVAANRVVVEVREENPMDLMVHDSFRFDMKDKKNLPSLVGYLKEALEFQAEELFKWLPIPLTVSFKGGYNWGEMEKIDA